jgi:hypothetical protein
MVFATSIEISVPLFAWNAAGHMIGRATDGPTA